MTEFKDVYLCNLIKNCDCSKSGCHINGEIDACYLTSNPDFAFIKDETPVIVMKKNDFLSLKSLGLDIGEQLDLATKTAIKEYYNREKKE